ncbi:MAG: myo-inositol 2-dehydrogenase/D-chiro-inositol 1-dehydrogenase [Planctomycetota bacterium]|jgi:myo-inositol 2-dehydrogenase/D-chiro-inositol 1-dehydrogenase
MTNSSTRRQMLGASSAALASAALTSPSALASAPIFRARSHGDAPLRIALVGCGGRGTGAASQALSTAGDVKLVAMADAFGDRLQGSVNQLAKNHAERMDVPEERRFTGFDAYEKAIACDVDVVILATPPGFRPMHFAHAVANNKHVFMEKPVATDAGGIRTVLAAAQVAKDKNLKVGVGLQRHHQQRYIEGIKRVQDGAIGEVNFMRAYWNSGGVWVRERQPGQTEMEYQMRNWYYFNWLCGDHITEQHIHNLDVCNWLKGGPPVSARGMGGRQVRTGMDHGEIFDHHVVEYTYADGSVMHSECRHQKGTWSSVSEHAHGSKGTANLSRGRIEGPNEWRFRADEANPYQVEHDDLFRAIREDIAYNEAEYGAASTMTSILGRMATYSGQDIKYDAALASTKSIMPTSFGWDATPPTVPDEHGRYPIPTPGQTEVL